MRSILPACCPRKSHRLTLDPRHTAGQLDEMEQATRSESADEVDRLREDNRALDRQVRALERAADLEGGGPGALSDDAHHMARQLSHLEAERDAYAERCEGAEAEVERVRMSHKRELRVRAREAAEANEELQRCKAQVRELRLKNRDLAAVRSPFKER